MITLDSVYRAHANIQEVIRNTSLIEATNLLEGKSLFLKCENLQRTGSFKLRGAFNKISQLTDEEKAKGIIACSAGNHAQGVALSAKHFGIPAIICMPEGAPISKIEGTKRYGAQVELHGASYDDASAHARFLQEQKDYTFIHPFDDEAVIAGQGTIALEILQALPDVDAVVVPIGGGGLISGIAYTLKNLKPRIKVYGVQAAAAPSMLNALQNKAVCSLTQVNTFADGIAVKRPGELTFQIIEKYVDEVVTVTEDEIATAILMLMEKRKLVCEGAGAVSVAACLFEKVPTNGKVCCILSGGNIDVNILNRVINRGLIKTGRLAKLSILLTDKPGELGRVTSIVAEHAANIISVAHDRADKNSKVNSCILSLELETRDHSQVNEICAHLEKDGFYLIDQRIFAEGQNE